MASCRWLVPVGRAAVPAPRRRRWPVRRAGTRAATDTSARRRSRPQEDANVTPNNSAVRHTNVTASLCGDRITKSTLSGESGSLTPNVASRSSPNSAAGDPGGSWQDPAQGDEGQRRRERDEETGEDEEADGTVEGDLTDSFAGVGGPALGSRPGGCCQDAHHESPSESDDEQTGDEPCRQHACEGAYGIECGRWCGGRRGMQSHRRPRQAIAAAAVTPAKQIATRTRLSARIEPSHPAAGVCRPADADASTGHRRKGTSKCGERQAEHPAANRCDEGQRPTVAAFATHR